MVDNSDSADHDPLLPRTGGPEIPADAVTVESEPSVVNKHTRTEDIIGSLAASDLLTPAEAAAWVHVTHNDADVKTVAEMLDLQTETVRTLNERATQVIDAASQLAYITHNL